jgi:hypothetical protein
MSRYKTVWNEKSYKKAVKEKGSMSGGSYVPWIQVYDFPSKGVVSRVKGMKTGRVHHLLSNLETDFFLALDWSDDVIDIREQYPLLEVEDTVAIAESIGVKHPRNNKSGFPYVMTTDFLVEKMDRMEAIAIKPSGELEKSRVNEKLEIEKLYWKNRGISWKVATEKDISRVRARNIEWLKTSMDLDELGLSPEKGKECIEYLMSRRDDLSLRPLKVFKAMEADMGVQPGMGLAVFKHLTLWKKIEFDVEVPVKQLFPF